jgi:MoaA/NifB/PqqE/SkfB family radical SAM enzyme
MRMEDIRCLHLELTSRCNASCPSCPRNNKGFGLAPGLIEQDLPLERLAEVMDLLPGIDTLFYCGNKGDCIAAKNFVESIDLIMSRGIERILIRTNGSLKTTAWWSALACRLKDLEHEVWFALDGLADTHAIYRQNTDFHKVIANAQSFIEGGGKAVWQFIPFKHNQHQIIDVIRLSQQLGFERIEFLKNVRYPSEARHHLTGEPIEILPWDHQAEYDRLRGDPFDTHISGNDHVRAENCMHLSWPSMYLGADGMLSPCCYTAGVDHREINIVDDFKKQNWRAKCLKWCGSKA